METTVYEYRGIKFNQYALNKFPKEKERYFSWLYIELFESSKQNKTLEVEILYHEMVRIYGMIFIDLHSPCKFTLKWLPKSYCNESGVYAGTIAGLFNIPEIEDDQWRKNDVALSHSKWYPNTTTILAVPKADKKHPERKSCFTLYGFFERDSIFCPGTTEKVTWSGNYGVIIEELGKDHYLLHFSCGEFDFKDVTFQDLELELTIEGDYTPCFRCSDFSLWKKYRDQDVAQHEAEIANKNS